MNRRIRLTIAREQGKIAKRLIDAVRLNPGGPVLSATNIHYEISGKTRAVTHGGLGLITRLVRKVGLAERIDKALHLLKIHKPYHESDHVLSIAYSALCGGQTLDDIELLRKDRVMLDALGAESIPDPTTAGDFCRRFGTDQITTLMDVINETRLNVWRQTSPR